MHESLYPFSFYYWGTLILLLLSCPWKSCFMVSGMGNIFSFLPPIFKVWTLFAYHWLLSTLRSGLHNLFFELYPWTYKPLEFSGNQWLVTGQLPNMSPELYLTRWCIMSCQEISFIASCQWINFYINWI